MNTSANLGKALLGVVNALVLALGGFVVLTNQSRNMSLQSATPIASPSQAPYPLPATATPNLTPLASPLPPTPTPAAYPLPPTATPNLTPRLTIIRVFTPPASLIPPPPPGTSLPTPLSASEELRQGLMRLPPEKRLVIDGDTIASIGIGKGDIHDGEERRDRMVVAVYHIPSLSVINIDISNTVTASNYRSPEGQQRLEAILVDSALMSQLHDFLNAYIIKLPK